MDFSDALLRIKAGQPMSRRNWGLFSYKRKAIVLNPGLAEGYSYLELIYLDGRTPGRVPWLPNRCDMLEEDWVEIPLTKMPRWWKW